MKEIVLQQMAFGPANGKVNSELYYRYSGSVVIRHSEKRIEFGKYGLLKLDTFFNALSVPFWRHVASISDVFFVVRGRGKFSLRIELLKNDSIEILNEQIIELSDSETSIKIGEWSRLFDGIVYPVFEALSDGAIFQCQYNAITEIINQIRLGIVITHFNREKAVLGVLRKITDELLIDPVYRDQLSIFIVDNSRSLPKIDLDHVKVIKNPNWGGAGGFARGLLEVKKSGRYTHCLFMDDDAIMDLESIRRTLVILALTRDSKLAIAGALFDDKQTSLVKESGARFDRGMVASIGCGIDVRTADGILSFQSIDIQPSYGAWWYFAFPIRFVTHYPFPFFVRGDDILFGLQNSFSIVRPIGIGSWGPDFGYKSSPMTRYLDVRYHLVICCGLLQFQLTHIALLIIRFFLSALFSYNYASARSVTIAVRHFLMGREFWGVQLDLGMYLNEIGQNINDEKLKSIELSEDDLKSLRIKPERTVKRILRWITLNGILLPDIFFKSGPIVDSKKFRATFSRIFLFRHVIYYDEQSGTGYQVKMSRKRMLKEIILFLREFIKLCINWKSLKHEYSILINKLTHEEFWEKRYGMKNA